MFFLSCNGLKKSNNLNNDIQFKHDLTKDEKETLMVNWEPTINNNWKFEDSSIICKLENDTLKFSTHEGWGPTIHLNIEIFVRPYLDRCVRD